MKKTFYQAQGSVRGSCGHKHRSVAAASRCADQDANGCAAQGGYSDRRVLAVTPDGATRSLDDWELDELFHVQEER